MDIKPKKKLVRKNFKVDYGKYKDKTLVWVINNDIEYFKAIKSLYYARYNEFHKKYYDHLYLIVNRKLNFINKVSDQEKLLTRDIVEEMKIGTTLGDILDKFSEDFTTKQVYDGITRAKVVIKKFYEDENSRMIDLHILRYEDFFKENINPDLSKIPPAYRKTVIHDKFNIAMEALLAKEKMLGIHTKTFKVKFSGYINSQKEKEKKDFDFKKLSIQERYRLLELIDKTEIRKGGELKTFIKPNEDVEDVVIISETKKENEIIESPLRDVKILNKKEEEIKQQPKSGKTFEEIQRMIQENIKKEMEEKFPKNDGKSNVKDFRE